MMFVCHRVYCGDGNDWRGDGDKCSGDGEETGRNTLGMGWGQDAGCGDGDELLFPRHSLLVIKAKSN